jgi:16S rRNA processing protein RimM
VPEYFLIARIKSAYGKDGSVKIISYSDFPDRFYNLKKVYIDFFGSKKEFLVEGVKEIKDSFIIKFKNFNSDQESGILSGKEIYVDEENLVKLPENYFFIHDLVGSRVLRNNEEFGIISEVLSLPANDVYVVLDSGGKEVLIPAVAEFIESFDAGKKLLILKPGKELYEEDDEV